jgi:hypothetical protein
LTPPIAPCSKRGSQIVGFPFFISDIPSKDYTLLGDDNARERLLSEQHPVRLIPLKEY